MRPALRSATPLKTKRRNRALAKFLYIIVILAAIFFGVGFLSQIPKFVINQVSVSGLKVLNQEEVSAKTLHYLDGKTALVYARGNIFIYSKKKVAEFIKNEFPRVYSIVSVDRTNRDLNILIEERRAAYLWCGEIPPAYIDRFENKDCYFLDQTGFIFDRSPFFTPGVYLTFYGGIKTGEEIIGQTIALKNSIAEFSQLTKDLELSGFDVDSIYMKEDGQSEMLLSLLSDTGDYAKILFNENEPLIDIASKVESLSKEESFAKEFADKRFSLMYIDTRFGNKVFYKFK